MTNHYSLAFMALASICIKSTCPQSWHTVAITGKTLFTFIVVLPLFEDSNETKPYILFSLPNTTILSLPQCEQPLIL